MNFKRSFALISTATLLAFSCSVVHADSARQSKIKELQVSDLVEMVGSVPFQKLVHGLRIITPDEISQISPSKLKIVLKYGNMHTVETLQSKFGSKSIIIVVNKLSESELKFLLEEDNLDVISAVIEGMQFAN